MEIGVVGGSSLVGRRVVVVERYGEHGGAQEVALQLAVDLNAAGVGAHLLLLSDGPMVGLAQAKGVDVEVVRGVGRVGVVSTARTTMRLLRRLRVLRPAVVVANGSALRAIVAPAARLSHTPLSWHVYDPMRMISRRQRALGLLQRAQTPITTVLYSEGAARTVPALPGRHGTMIRLDPPTSVEAIRAGERRPVEAVAAAPMFVVMFARVTRYKGHLDLIDALALGADRLRHLHVAMAGKFLPDEYLDEIRARLTQLGLEERVHLLGFVDDDSRNWLLANARAVVHPSRLEPFGLPVVEAFAAGTPVLAAAAEGPARVLAGGGGILYPPGDVAALADGLLRLIEDDALRSSLAARAWERAAEFDTGHHVRQLLAAWSEGLTGADRG